MINLTLWDHAFALAVFVVFPIYSKLTFEKELASLKRAGDAARIKAYQHVIVTWIVFSLCVLILWRILERPWADLGIQNADLLSIMIGFVIATIVVAVLVMQLRSLYLSEQGQAELKAQLGELAFFMPKSKSEVRWFTCLSANAGITEELIFRGYLIWYLQHFVGLWPAAVMSVILFGLAHAYQGWRQVPAILIFSAIATGLYIYTGSLLVPIVFHFVVDAVQGVYIARIQNAAHHTN